MKTLKLYDESAMTVLKERIDELEDQLEKKEAFGKTWKQISINGQGTISELKVEVEAHLNKISDLERIISGMDSEGRTLDDLKADYGILS